MTEEKKITKYLQLPSIKKFPKEGMRFRFVNLGRCIDVVPKHQGKRELESLAEYQAGSVGSMYDKFDKPGSSKFDDDEALERHNLLYTTTCGDTDADNAKEAQKSCSWCKHFMKGIKTLRRKKYLVGFVVDQNNVPVMLNLAKPTLASDVLSVKNKGKLDKWVELYVGTVDLGNSKQKTIRAKLGDKIENLDALDEELLTEHDLSSSDFDLNINDYLIKYWDGKKDETDIENYDEEE